MSVRPRATGHRGRVTASGLFLPDVLPPELVRRRLLSLWSPGSEVHRLRDGHVVLFPVARRLDAGRCPGSPLVRHRETLLAAPLTGRELASLPEGGVVLVRAGVAEVETLSAGTRVDAADWLELDGLESVPVSSLGAAPAAVERFATRAVDIRRELAGVPPADPGLGALVAALRSAGPSSTPGGSRVTSLMGAALLRLRALFARSLTRLLPATGPGRAAPAPAPAPAAPARESLLHKLLTRLAMLTSLSEVLGRKHAAYILRMLEMFERGDTEDALRHAIPLGSLGDSLRPPGLALLPPRPRTDLTIAPRRAGASSRIPMGDELLARLRQTYRAAFARLEAQGRFDEAAFVLSELLQEHEEAVAFLERHGRLRLAAEMAEARGLSPGLVVRQWLVARDTARAVSFARRTGAFADAVVRLERTGGVEGRVLRVLWAEALADAGDFAAAVEAVWPVGEARRLALAWIERGLETGGPARAQLLLRRLELVPESFDDVRGRALALLESSDVEGAPARRAFAEALARGKAGPEQAVLARPAVRALLRDALVPGEATPPVLLRNLIALAGDAALKADLPPVPRPGGPPLHERRVPQTRAFARGDAGALPLWDAALLPSGKALLALGEAGARLVSTAGATVATFAEPAYRFVLADNGARALAMAPRGEAMKVARLDLLTGRCDSWCEARLTAFAGDYDGSLWFAASGDELLAIDAIAPGFRSLWQTSGVGRLVLAIARDPARCAVVAEGRGGLERWGYELPSLTLREREPFRLPAAAGVVAQRALSPPGRLVEHTFGQPPGWTVRVHDPGAEERRFEMKLARVGEKPAGLSLADPWLAAAVAHPEGVRVHLLHLGNTTAPAILELGGAGRVSLRLGSGHLTVADDRGRCVALSLDDGSLLRDLRVS